MLFRLNCFSLAVHYFSAVSIHRHRSIQSLFSKPQLSAKSVLLTAKRKSYTLAAHKRPLVIAPVSNPPQMSSLSLSVRRASRRKASQAKAEPTSMNPDDNPNVLDGPQALRASPDADGLDERLNLEHAGLIIEKQVKEETEDAPLLISSDEYDSPLSELSYVESPVKATNSKIRSTSGMRVKSEGGAGSHKKIAQAAKPRSDPARDHQFLDPEAEGDEEADEEEIQAALSRPPPVNSDYLPLPWKGRLGYVGQNMFHPDIC